MKYTVERINYYPWDFVIFFEDSKNIYTYDSYTCFAENEKDGYKEEEKKAEDSRSRILRVCKRRVGFRTTRVVEKHDPKRRG